MVSLAFILAFVGSAVALLIGIIIFSQVQDDMLQTFGDPIQIGNATSKPIVHAYAEQISPQTHTGDTNYATIPNISLSSGEFTAGNKYLVMFRADVQGDPTNSPDPRPQVFSIRSQHGSTDFTGSEKAWRHTSGSGEFQYNYFTVWTAVGGEGLTMQFRNVNDSTRTVTADQITIVAIELEEFVEGEDYFFDVRTTQDILTLSWTATNPSITFTPNGSDDWLVMANSRIFVEPPFTDSPQSRINLDDSTLLPLMRVSGDRNVPNPENIDVHFLTRVYTPSASSHTFEVESSTLTGASSPIRDYSHIFAINLDKFEFHADNYIGTSFQPNTNIYTEPLLAGRIIESNSMTVDFDTTEDTFILSFNLMEYLDNSSGQFRQRMQIDDGSGTDFIQDTSQKESYKDTPLTQTGNAQPINVPNRFYHSYEDGVNGDIMNWSVFTMQDLPTTYPLNSGVVDVDVDSVSNAPNGNAKIGGNQLVAVSMSVLAFEFASQVPPEFITASNIAFTVIGIVPIVLFFFLFAIFGGRFGE